MNEKGDYCSKHGKPIIINMVNEVLPALVANDENIEKVMEISATRMCCKCIGEFNGKLQKERGLIEVAHFEKDYGIDSDNSYRTDCGWISASRKKDTKFCPRCGRVLKYMRKKEKPLVETSPVLKKILSGEMKKK